MQIPVYAVLIIAERNLLPFLNCRVNDLDIVKQGLVVRLAPLVHRPDVFDVRTKILVGKRTKPLNEFFGMLGGNITARQHAVYEHTEFGIVERALSKIAAPSVGGDIIPSFFQKRQIAPNCLTLNGNAVISVKIINDILLFERMIEIAVLFQNLQNAHQRQFRRFK